MSSLERTWHIDLGVSECETCGSNFEEIEAELYRDEAQAHWRVGCYGGSSISGSAADVAAWLLALLDRADPCLAEVADDVRLVAEELIRSATPPPATNPTTDPEGISA